LGYFINPLFSVALGVIFFRERLRPAQWLPIVLAAAGVATLTVAHGELPWVALTLASSFGVYGLVKKMAPLNSVFGLTIETGILFLPAVAYLVSADLVGEGTFAHAGAATDVLLVGAGAATTLPLLMFASAARRLPLSLLGLMQYIAPSLQFLIGVLIYAEPFTRSHTAGFGLVWLGLVIFCVEGQFARTAAAPQSIT
jgi:chloramphenicol-sensitive protein RarD